MRVVGWILVVLLLALVALLALLRWQPASVPVDIVRLLPEALVESVRIHTDGAPAQAPSSSVDTSTAPEGPKIYAWKDDQGRWNYTDTPPTDRPYETRQYRQDVNVVPAYQPDPDADGG